MGQQTLFRVVVPLDVQTDIGKAIWVNGASNGFIVGFILALFLCAIWRRK